MLGLDGASRAVRGQEQDARDQGAVLAREKLDHASVMHHACMRTPGQISQRVIDKPLGRHRLLKQLVLEHGSIERHLRQQGLEGGRQGLAGEQRWIGHAQEGRGLAVERGEILGIERPAAVRDPWTVPKVDRIQRPERAVPERAGSADLLCDGRRQVLRLTDILDRQRQVVRGRHAPLQRARLEDQDVDPRFDQAARQRQATRA